MSAFSLLLALLSAVPAAPSHPFASSWWDDGQAEVCGQDLRTPRQETIRLVARQGGRAGRPAVADAQAAYLGPQAADDNDSTIVLRVEVTSAAGRDQFDYAAEAPHVLRRWVWGNGARYTLRRSQRLAYWRYARSGLENMLLDTAAEGESK